MEACGQCGNDLAKSHDPISIDQHLGMGIPSRIVERRHFCSWECAATYAMLRYQSCDPRTTWKRVRGIGDGHCYACGRVGELYRREIDSLTLLHCAECRDSINRAYGAERSTSAQEMWGDEELEEAP